MKNLRALIVIVSLLVLGGAVVAGPGSMGGGTIPTTHTP
jgi:hypothetical protein